MRTVQHAIDRAFRAHSGAVLATLIRVLGSFDRAEDAMHEAFLRAAETWPQGGVPENPAAWITTVARRKAIDRARRDATVQDKERALEALAVLEDRERSDAALSPHADVIADDQLRLIFTCCHPALSPEARVALTLRTLGGLTTSEISAAFVVPEATMAQRLVRAKRKIRDAQIPYQVPPASALGERLGDVLAVVYLVFNEGYFPHGRTDAVRADLCRDAIRLGRVLTELLPDSPEVIGLLALMLLHDSRRAARGRMLEEQDRALWNRTQIEDGITLVKRALSMRPVGPYQLQAAIAAVHAEAEHFADTDWHQIAGLYAALARAQPSPIVELNRAVAISMADGPEAGLSLIGQIERHADLRDYQPYHAAKADLLRRAGRGHEAAACYQRAISMATSDVAREYLHRRLSEVNGG